MIGATKHQTIKNLIMSEATEMFMAPTAPVKV
jgi:hypothetical protein